jgi:poly-gamma-glutamate synthesis protein (capsule biosynthesis protein)
VILSPFRSAVLAVGLLAVIVAAAPAASPSVIRIGFAGDIMLSYEMTPYLEEFGPHYPFRGSEAIFRPFDLFCANLECPISDVGLPLQNKSFYFRSAPWTVHGLVFAGVGLVSLANNHVLDFGDEALSRTTEILAEKGIGWVGAGHDAGEASTLRVIVRNGVRLGFLAYNLAGPDMYQAGPDRPGTAVCNAESLSSNVKAALASADHVVVFFHWGEEYSPRPDEAQRILARAAIDAGADCVVGCHPHVVQPVEIYKNRLIAYSLGNYAFGSWGRPPDRTADAGLILELDMDRTSLKKAVLYPLNVFNYEVKFNPRPCPSGTESEAVLKRVLPDTEGWTLSDDRSEFLFPKN